MVISAQNSPEGQIPHRLSILVNGGKEGENEVVSVPTFHLRFGLETVNIRKCEPPG
jgi:hypothetical protein